MLLYKPPNWLELRSSIFATTALVATAGVAAADVSVSANGYMGVRNDDRAVAADNEVQFVSRFRVAFSASGETDTGLSFGGSIRADNAVGGAAGTAGSVFISGAFGKLTMGDVDSAHKAATGNVAGVGYTGLSDRNEVGHIGGGDDEGLLYSYTIEGLSVYLSAGQPNAASANNEVGFGASYTMSGFTIAAGMAEDGTSEQTSVALRGSFAGITLAAVMVDNNDVMAIDDEIAFSATYAVNDALSLTAFTREVDVRVGTDLTYTGIGAAYNLGGGASLRAGYVDGGVDGQKLNSWDLGVTFSF
ncbi:porin [Rhodobacterales bacterium LSUCC0031]|nr:porin [Rhodobacterales bacterium LSUCC0031]